MVVSFGFLVVLILILFPGLLFRRLYFYGEFSKQFNSSHNLISLIAISTIPGLINLVLVFFFYDTFVTDIDLGEVIDRLKDVNNPEFRFEKSSETPLKELINQKAAPFIGFIYTTSVIFGVILGRFTRFSRIDTRFKLLRFKNYWFYLFNGQHTGFKKMKHLKKRKKKYLFTKADILVDFNSETHLYSGIVVDYELLDSDCRVLSKVMLQNAERYSMKNEKRVPVDIPGSLLVVDCTTMKNINLTYVYEEAKNILESKLPNTVVIAYGIAFVLLIPIFIFKVENINIEIYEHYFRLSWYAKIVAYFLAVQVLYIFIPFTKKDNKYEFANIKSILANLILILILTLLLWFLG